MYPLGKKNGPNSYPMGPSIQKPSSGEPVNTKAFIRFCPSIRAEAFIRWARQYESLHPVGPSIQKPSSDGPVNTKAFFLGARQYKSLHLVGPSTQKPSSRGPVHTKAFIRWAHQDKSLMMMVMVMMLEMMVVRLQFLYTQTPDQPP